MSSLIINGEARDGIQAETVSEFLEQHDLHSRMVVVERNGEIVPRERFADTRLSEGDVLEIVQMMAGG